MALLSLKTGKAWKLSMVLMALLALVLVVGFVGWQWHLSGRLAEEEQYARDHGFPITPEDLNGWMVMPDEENGGLAFEEILNEDVRGDAYDRLSTLESEHKIKFEYGVGWPDEALTLAKEHCDDNPDVIEGAIAVPRFERGRYPFDYAREMIEQDPLMLDQPYLGASGRVARLLQTYASVCASEERQDEAIEAIHAVFNLRRSLNHEITPIGQFVGIRLSALGIDLTERVLSMAEASDEALIALQEDLIADDAVGQVMRSFQSDRVTTVCALNGESQDFDVRQSPLSQLGLQTRNLVITHRFFNELSEKSPDEIQAFVDSQEGATRWSIAQQMIDFRVIVIPSAYRTAKQLEAIQMCAYTGMAAYRYKLEHGAFPESLEALVPEYLDTVPEDPFVAGEPLKMVKTAFGMCIYSTSSDGVDNGGRRFNEEGKTYQEGADVTFWCFETPGVAAEVEQKPEVDPRRRRLR